MAEPIEQTRSVKKFPRYADVSRIRTRFAESIQEIIEAAGEVTLIARRERSERLMALQRDEPALSFNHLRDVGGVDQGEFDSTRFSVAYQLYSLEHNHRLRVKVFLAEDDAQLPTMFNLWKSANWLEREVYDM